MLLIFFSWGVVGFFGRWSSYIKVTIAKHWSLGPSSASIKDFSTLLFDAKDLIPIWYKMEFL